MHSSGVSLICFLFTQQVSSFYSPGGTTKCIVFKRWSQGRKTEIMVFYANFMPISSSHQGATEIPDELTNQ